MSGAIVQVVPNLEPYGGVASHARALARALEQHEGLSSALVTPEGTSSRARSDRLVAQLAAYPTAPILLHYSNYGYDRRGCPRWLLGALERSVTESRHARLISIFHEVYATGRPWESSFWLSPIQRRLAGRLRRMSEHAVTSLERYRDMLRVDNGGEVVTLPVFSTVGEPTSPTPLTQRRRRLVVFGSPGLRSRAYTTSRRELSRACNALEIGEIADVGPQAVAPRLLDGIPVESLAERPAADVSTLLSDSIAGFLSYPEDFVAKSTVFAAFASHRLVPVCAWPRNGHLGNPRVAARRHLWHATYEPTGAWQEIADAAHEWYQDHSLSRHAALYAELLR